MNDTESTSNFDHLENRTVSELLKQMNREDQNVPAAVEKAIPAIEKLVLATVKQLEKGGRLFYIGAGTSGRLGMVDASECPPTFGVPYGMVVGIIAGGEKALKTAVEFAEDDAEQAWKDLSEQTICNDDLVIGISASGTTPYVLGGLEQCKKNGIMTGAITSNSGSPVTQIADFPVEVVVGPEFITGSTRLKAGTAQKLVLNMISTSVMIRLGRIKGNKMIDMQLSNNKLINRGIRMIMEETGVDQAMAQELLDRHQSVRKAIDSFNNA